MVAKFTYLLLQQLTCGLVWFGLLWEWGQWGSTSHAPKLQYYWSLTIRLFSVIYQDIRWWGAYTSAEMYSAAPAKSVTLFWIVLPILPSIIKKFGAETFILYPCHRGSHVELWHPSKWVTSVTLYHSLMD